jgi:hypothetical protein
MMIKPFQFENIILWHCNKHDQRAEQNIWIEYKGCKRRTENTIIREVSQYCDDKIMENEGNGEHSRQRNVHKKLGGKREVIHLVALGIKRGIPKSSLKQLDMRVWAELKWLTSVKTINFQVSWKSEHTVSS